MADLKLVGAVAIKVRPDAKGFRRDTEKQIKKELSGVDATVEVKADVDTAGMKAKVKKAKEEVEAKEITLKVGVDYASVKRAQQRVNSMTRGLKDIELEVTMDEAGLARAKAELAGMEKNARVLITYANDTRGWNDVIARLEQIKRDKITKTIEFATDDASLESQIAFAKARIRNLGVDLHYTNDRSSIEAAIAEVDKRIRELDTATLHTKLDRASLEAAKAELKEKFDAIPATIRVNYDDKGSLEAAKAKLDAMLVEAGSHDIEIGVGEDGIRQARERIKHLIDEFDGQNVNLDVNANTAVTSAHLAYVARPRNVPFYATINKKSVAVVEGLLRSLAGVNTFKSVGNFLENLISNFDKISIKSAGWGTAIASISNSLIYMTGALFSIGGGVAQLAGFAALAPTVFGSFASSIIILSAVFKDFGDAVAGDTRALKLLPPAGKEAALAIGKVWADLRQSISKKFWDESSASMLRFVTHALPAFSRGLTTAAGGLGKVFSGLLNSFSNLAITGGLDKMYRNLNLFFEEGAKGATALWDALNTLGLQGTTLLPKFGGWLKDVSVQFNNWIQVASKGGDITRWINNAVRSLQSIWSAAGSTIDIFKALTRAFDRAGQTGLGGFANAMRRIADIMLSEPFQSDLANIFEGATRGASNLNKGVRDLGREFLGASRYVKDMLQGLGTLGGGLLTGLSRTFSNLKFQSGTLSALNGLKEAMGLLQIGFGQLGGVIGSLSDIAGAVFKNIAPILNSIVTSLNASLSLVGDNLKAMVPQMMHLFGGLLINAQGPLTLIIGLLNAVLTVLNAMPKGVSGVVIAFVGMLALRRQFAAFFTAISSGWARINATAGNGVATNGWMRNIRNVWAGTVTSINQDARRVNMSPVAGTFSKLSTTMGIAARGIAGSIKTAFLGLAGGWVGLAIIAIGVAFAVIGQKAAAAKAEMDSLQSTLSKVGQATDETITALSKKLVDANGINGSKKPIETLKLMGLTANDTAKQIASGGQAFDNMKASLVAAYKAYQSGVESVKDQNPNEQLKAGSAALQQWAKDAGWAGNLAGVTGADLLALGVAVNNTAGNLDVAKNSWDDINGSVQQTSQRVLDFDGAMNKLKDTTSEMPARIQAFHDAMDVLNGKVRTTDEVLKAYNTSASDMTDFLKNQTDGFKSAAEKAQFWAGTIDKVTGKINTVSRAGQDLDTQLRALTDNEISIVIDMQDRGVDPKEITKELDRARLAWIAQAKQAGISADEAGKAWDRMMGNVPKKVTTVITAEGVDTATEGVKTFGSTLAALDGQKAIAHVLGDNTDLTDKILSSTGSLAAFNKIVATATAKLDPTQADAVRTKLIVELAKMAAMDPTVKAKLDPTILENERTLIVARLIELGKMKPTPQVNARIDAAQSQLNYINQALDNTGGKRPNPVVSVGGIPVAANQLAGIQNQLNGLNNTVVTPTVRFVADVSQVNSALDYIKVKGGKYAQGGILNSSLTQVFANGGFSRPVHRYAGGGHEDHSAKIYSARTPFRVFAEPETGGEAYLPMAASKRPRSLAILKEVARRFGKTVTDGTGSYASGAIAAPAGSTSSSVVNAGVTIGQLITTNPDEAVRKLTQHRRDAMALAGRPLT